MRNEVERRTLSIVVEGLDDVVAAYACQSRSPSIEFSFQKLFPYCTKLLIQGIKGLAVTVSRRPEGVSVVVSLAKNRYFLPVLGAGLELGRRNIRTTERRCRGASSVRKNAFNY